MFDAFKNFFGMDTVKLRLDVLEAYPKTVETINGEVELRSATAHRVEDLHIRLVEVYTRGRGDEKRIDEYVLGEWHSAGELEVPAGRALRVAFAMPYAFLKSNMDELGDKNFILRGVAGLAKSLKGVSSDYYIIAEASVKGGKLKPFAKAKISII